jgi:hypothetical protein
MLVLKTAPTEEPVSAAELKLHLRLDTDDDNQYLDGLILAARAHVETITRRALIKQTWTLYLDGFPPYTTIGGQPFLERQSGLKFAQSEYGYDAIQIPNPILIGINSIKYTDPNGVVQTLASTEYTVDATSVPGRVVPVYGKTWPPFRFVPNAVAIEFDAGWADAASVPEPVQQAVKMLAAHWYENREAVNVGNNVTELPLAVESLLASYRDLRFF